MGVFNRVTSWLALKKYQIEVTFSVYIFTPGEKAIFWSVVFLLTALTLIATILYLPQHIAFLLSRAWFYFLGDDKVDVLELTKDAMHELAQGALGTLTDADGVVTGVGEAAEGMTTDGGVTEILKETVSSITTAVMEGIRDEL